MQAQADTHACLKHSHSWQLNCVLQGRPTTYFSYLQSFNSVQICQNWKKCQHTVGIWSFFFDLWVNLINVVITSDILRTHGSLWFITARLYSDRIVLNYWIENIEWGLICEVFLLPLNTIEMCGDSSESFGLKPDQPKQKNCNSSVWFDTEVLRSGNVSNQFILKWYCWEQQKKRETWSHCTQHRNVLSLAHSSVNSLLGPLAQRGVQGCKEINQQLTSHHLRSRFNSQDLAGSQCMRDMNSPEQTLFNSQAQKPSVEV